jgi:hypothetical protein
MIENTVLSKIKEIYKTWKKFVILLIIFLIWGAISLFIDKHDYHLISLLSLFLSVLFFTMLRLSLF